MPELPEVETVCRELASVLEGTKISKVTLGHQDLRFPIVDRFAEMLVGKQVLSIKRRAKFILIIFKDETVLIAHLGMSGSFRVYCDERPPIHKHDHVVFVISSDREVRYHDPRRFGFMILTKKADLKHNSMLKKLGPEPIAPNIDGPTLAARLQGRNGPIKSVLLNQTVVAGIGNIYACEILNSAKISPKRKAYTVRGKKAAKLAEAIVFILNAAIDVGGASLQDHRNPFGELGYFQNQFRVYGRVGKPCQNCGKGTLIKKIVQSGRATFYCSQCQR